MKKKRGNVFEGLKKENKEVIGCIGGCNSTFEECTTCSVLTCLRFLLRITTLSFSFLTVLRPVVILYLSLGTLGTQGFIWVIVSFCAKVSYRFEISLCVYINFYIIVNFISSQIKSDLVTRSDLYRIVRSVLNTSNSGYQ